MERKATFGAGCFWGVEAEFRQINGVTSTRVGYAGGHTKIRPTRRLFPQDGARRGRRGHLRPDRLSYDDLFKVFWDKHDPTQLNRQGWDVGDQYRSAIFFHDGEQQETAAPRKSSSRGNTGAPSSR